MFAARLAPPPVRPPAHRAPEVPPFALVPVAVLAGVAGLLLFLRADRYAHFGDELYFLAAGRHLAAGYADQGPVVAVLARIAELVAPGSLVVLRTPAVLATVAAVVVTAALAREFGGRTYVQLLAALAYATCPFALSQSASLSTFALDSCCSALVLWLAVRWTRLRDDRLLPVAVGVAALDLQIKWLAIVVVAGLVAGIALTGPRTVLRRRMLWMAAVPAAVTLVPGLVWQARHGWPQWAMGEIIAAEQHLATGGRAGLLGQQILQAGILGTVLVAGAVVGFRRCDALRPYRFVAVAAAVTLVFVFFTATRPYYTAGLLPALFAAGAVALAAWTGAGARWAGAVLGAMSAVLAVVVVAVLPLPAIVPDRPSDSAAQVYARMRMYGTSGWPELVTAVTRAYRELPADVGERTVIVTDTYWQAAALEYFAGSELPPVYSPNRGYAYFGTPPDTAGSVLYVGAVRGRTALAAYWRTVTDVATADDPRGFPGISRFVTVAHCSGPLRPWSEIWPGLRTLALDMGAP